MIIGWDFSESWLDLVFVGLELGVYYRVLAQVGFKFFD